MNFGATFIALVNVYVGTAYSALGYFNKDFVFLDFGYRYFFYLYVMFAVKYCGFHHFCHLKILRSMPYSFYGIAFAFYGRTPPCLFFIVF